MADSQTSRWADYQARLNRVLDFIHDHLDNDLDLNRLAEVACLSPYHWHRIYHGMLGETVAATVRRLRLHRAAGDLVRSNKGLREIARTCGFHSTQSFSRVFRSAFGITPGAYRTRGIPSTHSLELKEPTHAMYTVTIREFPPAHALTIAHTGSYMTISRAFDQLSGWIAAHGARSQAARMVGIFYDDPSVVPEDQLRSRAGVILPIDLAPEPPVERTVIPGGRYAVVRHQGPYAELYPVYQWLYGQWLPQSGEVPADAPAFEEYLNTPMDTAPPDLLTDICVPLR